MDLIKGYVSSEGLVNYLFTDNTGTGRGKDLILCNQINITRHKKGWSSGNLDRKRDGPYETEGETDHLEMSKKVRIGFTSEGISAEGTRVWSSQDG